MIKFFRNMLRKMVKKTYASTSSYWLYSKSVSALEDKKDNEEDCLTIFS
jgi:hypothetical protein